MPGRRWTAKEWAEFQAELERLEQSDPEVRKAAQRLDQVTWEIAHRPPPRRFLRRLGGHAEPLLAITLGTVLLLIGVADIVAGLP